MRSITRLVGVFLIGLAALGLIASFAFPSNEQRLQSAGVEVKGRVLDKWIGDPRSAGTFKRSFNFIAYEYPTASGQHVRAELSLWTRTQQEAVKIGAPLIVRYLPSDPRVHEVVDYRDEIAAHRTMWGRLIMCVVLLVIGGGMLLATRPTPEAGAGGAAAEPVPVRRAPAADRRPGRRGAASFSTRSR